MPASPKPRPSHARLARLDRDHVWHPFTQMRDWMRADPVIVVSGKGVVLTDSLGRQYLDGNASIWTNLHGHNHPAINRALRRQMTRIAHSSALGLASEPATLLAARLVDLARTPSSRRGRRGDSAARRRAASAAPALEKVFFSDDGSTALEVALKLAYEFARRARGIRRPRFVSLDGAYHGDTIGAVSLGHIDLFHKAYGGLLFGSDKIMAPYCYRCPFNRAKPDRADARTYRRCHWECVGKAEAVFARRKRQGTGEPHAGFVFEPLVQGAAGMIPQPEGWLRQVTDIARAHDTPLIADEVMTAFGRANSLTTRSPRSDRRSPDRPGARSRAPLLACHQEGVAPDFLALAKGLTGGYLPMAATLTTRAVFDAFLGDYDEFRTFFHGHSYCGNALGSAAALASLDLLQFNRSERARETLEANLRRELNRLWELPAVGDIRQCGLVAGIELVKDWRTRTAFDLGEQAGVRVCRAMARRGVLTRPIGNVIVLMPPYCTTARQIRQLVGALYESVEETLPPA